MLYDFLPTYIRNNIRYYKTKEGDFPSVNHVLQKTMSDADKMRLAVWRQNLGDAHAKAYQEFAAQRGYRVHSAIEAWLKQNGVDPYSFLDNSDEDKVLFERLMRVILNDVSEIFGIASWIYHPVKEYAGRLDLLGYWNGELSIIDYKTKMEAKSLQYLSANFLQLAAYGAAVNFHFAKLGRPERIEQYVIIPLVPHEALEPIVTDQNGVRAYSEEFFNRLDLFNAHYHQ